MNIVEYFGMNLNDVVIGMCILIGIVFIMFIVTIINIVQNKKLKKKYNAFMTGSDASTLEETIVSRLEQIDELVISEEQNKIKLDEVIKKMEYSFQKIGMVKYDAFNEMGGKLSFTLALLNSSNTGFVINAMHSREGCYTYIKEIMNGNSIIVLSEEEKEALNDAMNTNNSKIVTEEAEQTEEK